MSFLSEQVYLNEMAKRAQERITTRLSKERKLIFLVCKCLENKEGSPDAAFTIQVWQHIATRLAGVTWEEFCEVFNIPEGDRENATRITQQVKKMCSEKYARLYAHMKRTIEVHSDEIDKKYINPAEKAFNQLSSGIAPDVVYEQNNMGEVLDWFVNNPEEATDRLGESHYKKYLARFIVWLHPERYHNTIQEAKDQFKQYTTAHRADQQVKMDNELLYKLALIIKSGDPLTMFGERTVADAIVKIVKQYFGGERNIPSLGACKLFLHLKLEGNKFVECSDDEVSEDEFSQAERVKIAIDRLPGQLTLIQEDSVKQKITECCKNIYNNAKDGDNIRSDYFDMDNFGTVPNEYKSNVIKDVYVRCVNELNRDYAVGFKAPFMFQGADTREKSRNYYRTYVPLFKLQLKKDYLFQVFKEIANAYKAIYEEEKRQYHQSMNNDDSVDFEEAVRLVRRHGYIVD